nr:hypothetical protein CE91St29_11110 [Corynebacterium striatum]
MLEVFAMDVSDCVEENVSVVRRSDEYNRLVIGVRKHLVTRIDLFGINFVPIEINALSCTKKANFG